MLEFDFRKQCAQQVIFSVIILLLLAPVKQYVAAVTAKKFTCPKTKSYGIVTQNVKDHLLSVAKQVQPFLVSYQTRQTVP